MEYCFMQPVHLVLKCYAENKGDYWQAFCLDYTLAVQAETFDEAKKKLESMIISYLHDALSGDDKAYARQLLTRSAPASYWIKYYLYVLLDKIGVIKNDMQRLFTEVLPLALVC